MLLLSMLLAVKLQVPAFPRLSQPIPLSVTNRILRRNGGGS